MAQTKYHHVSGQRADDYPSPNMTFIFGCKVAAPAPVLTYESQSAEKEKGCRWKSNW